MALGEDDLKDQFYGTIEESKRIYSAEMKPKCGEKLLVGQRLENAHEEALRVALFFFDSCKLSSSPEENRSQLVKEISKQKQAYQKLSRGIAVDKLQSKADLSSQTYCNLIEEEVQSCISVDKLKVFHKWYKSKALKCYKGSKVKEPRQYYEEILKNLEEEIDSYYAYMEAKFIEEKKRQEKQMKRKIGFCIVVSALLFIVIASTLHFYIKRNEEFERQTAEQERKKAQQERKDAEKIERKKAEQIFRNLEEYYYAREMYSVRSAKIVAQHVS